MKQFNEHGKELTGAEITALKQAEKRKAAFDKDYAKKASPFIKWFNTFLEEKKIELGDYLTDDIQVGDVCQAIVDTTDSEQAKIKDTLVKIDFKNGNVCHYLKHLSQALEKKR